MSLVGKHWCGEERLGLAFWRNLVGVDVALSLLAIIAAAVLSDEASAAWSEKPALLLAGMVIGSLAVIAVTAWQVVGVWRAAGARNDRVWPWAARLFAVTDAALMASALAMVAPGAVITYRLAFADTFDHATVAVAGDTVHLSGLITADVGAAVVSALDRPAVTTLAISSPGGMAWASKHIETVVHRRGLTVVAGPLCLSACTIILASGKRRAALPGTLFGFHRAQKIGPAPRFFANGFGEDAEDILRWAGADTAFVARALGPQTDRALYRPGLGELAAEGILTHVLDAGRLVPARYWCSRHAQACRCAP